MVVVRQEINSDIKDVYRLYKVAFGQKNEADLVNQLRQNEAFIPELSLVAQDHEKVVGHIFFTKIVIRGEDGKENDSLALAPMAVRPDYQKRGIGGQMIRKGLAKARELGFKSVIVLGHEHYSPNFGFVPVDKWHFKAPIDIPANSYMGLELYTNALKEVTVTVIYLKEFEAL